MRDTLCEYQAFFSREYVLSTMKMKLNVIIVAVRGLVGWVVLRINVALAIFQPYRDLEARDN